MEVTIHSNVTGALGVAVICTDPDQTIGSLLRAFCLEKRISGRSDLVLTNCRQEILQRNRKLSSYGILNGEELYLSLCETDRWLCGCNQWWILACVSLAIGAAGIVAISYTKSLDYNPDYAYGVGLDAGSTHTNLYVYRWPAGKYNGTGVVYQVYSCSQGNKSMKALSSFVDNPKQAGSELQPCLDDAQHYIPKKDLSRTPIFLGATAGMRLLNISNNSAAEEIMSSVRETIKTYKFKIENIDKQVRIIEGTEEGTFSWISTNYLSGKFGFQPMATVRNTFLQSEADDSSNLLGALDMGGASTQITFVPEHESSLIDGFKEIVHLYGSEYGVYTYSYQCYGLQEGYRRLLALLVQESNNETLVYDPCSERNTSKVYTYDYIFQVPCTLSSNHQIDPSLQVKNFTVVGTSDTGSCRNATMKLFNFTAACHFSACSFNGVYQPQLFGSYLAFAGYFKLMNALNLTSPNSTLADFVLARDSYCTAFQPRSNFNYCFQAHFIYNVLIDGYNFSDANWASVTFTEKVNGADLGWILGMMINATNIITPVKTESFTISAFIILIILFSAFILLSIGFACHGLNQNRQERDKYHRVPTTYGAI